MPRAFFALTAAWILVGLSGCVGSPKARLEPLADDRAPSESPRLESPVPPPTVPPAEDTGVLTALVTGTYVGTLTTLDGREDAPELAEDAAYLGPLSLELREDARFRLKMLFRIEGRWALEGRQVVLTAETVDGRAVEKGAAIDVKGEPVPMSLFLEPKRLLLSEDGRELLDRPEGQPYLVIFRKADSANGKHRRALDQP